MSSLIWSFFAQGTVDLEESHAVRVQVHTGLEAQESVDVDEAQDQARMVQATEEDSDGLEITETAMLVDVDGEEKQIPTRL